MADFRLASNEIDDVKLGSDQVDKVYLGSMLVWQSLTAPVWRNTAPSGFYFTRGTARDIDLTQYVDGEEISFGWITQPPSVLRITLSSAGQLSFNGQDNISGNGSMSIRVFNEVGSDDRQFTYNVSE